MQQKRVKLAVAIDTSPFSIAVLDEAMFYARISDAELKVILVEDINMLNAAKSPLVRSVNMFSLSASSINSEEVEDIYGLQRAKAQDTLKYASEKNHIKAVLDIRRGKVAQEIIEASKDSDALIIGWAGWRFAKYYYSTHMLQKQSRFKFPNNPNIEMGRTAKYLLQHHPKTVSVLKGSIFKNSKIMIYYDGSPLSKTVLDNVLSYLFDFKTKTNYSLSILLSNKSLRDEAYLSIAARDIDTNPAFFTIGNRPYQDQMRFIEELIINSKTNIFILNENCEVTKEERFYVDINRLTSSLMLVR